MTTNKRQFTLRLQENSFEKIKIIAEINKRSIANQIELLIDKFISDYEKKHGPILVKKGD